VSLKLGSAERIEDTLLKTSLAAPLDLFKPFRRLIRLSNSL